MERHFIYHTFPRFVPSKKRGHPISYAPSVVTLAPYACLVICTLRTRPVETLAPRLEVTLAQYNYSFTSSCTV